jgi:RNA polymerase sigma-70 factor (ECF subfamily)
MEWAERLRDAAVDEPLADEFDARLAESSRLAFRVAYGVLRQREDAEDVAQEALLRAYRHFRRLRDRDRFRSWIVRVAWRLAIATCSDNATTSFCSKSR